MNEEHFIISLSTLPSRFHNLKICLESLLNQDYVNYEIHLNIPRYNVFEGNYNHSIPENGKLKVFYINDIGSISKLFYTLERTTSKHQRIITVDDDFIYSKDMLKVYNKAIREFKDVAIGFAGIYPIKTIDTPRDLECIGPVSIPRFVGILEGYKSVCYRRDFFQSDFFESVLEKNMKWCENSVYFEDDVVISSYLGYKNIPKLVIPPIRIDTSCDVPKMLSFPLEIQLHNPKSGCNKHRELFGNAGDNIKATFNSELGKYIRV